MLRPGIEPGSLWPQHRVLTIRPSQPLSETQKKLWVMFCKKWKRRVSISEPVALQTTALPIEPHSLWTRESRTRSGYGLPSDRMCANLRYLSHCTSATIPFLCVKLVRVFRYLAGLDLSSMQIHSLFICGLSWVFFSANIHQTLCFNTILNCTLALDSKLAAFFAFYFAFVQ